MWSIKILLDVSLKVDRILHDANEGLGPVRFRQTVLSRRFFQRSASCLTPPTFPIQ